MLKRPVHPDAKRARREVTVFVPDERIEEERRKLIRLYQKHLNLPGYRKGHVPEEVVVDVLGEELEEEAFEKALKETLKQELEERGLEPISRVKIEEKETEEAGQRVRLSFDVLPDFELPDISSIQLEKHIPPVKEEEVEEILQREAVRHATLEEVDREIQEGDAVRADIILKTPSGRRTLKKSKNVLLFVDDSQPPKVKEALIGKKAGDTVDVDVERGRYRIVVHQVFTRVIPEINDDFAKTLGYDSLDALKEAIRERLRKVHEDEAEDNLEAELIETLYNQVQFDLPESMVADELDELVEKFREDYGVEEVTEDIRSELRRIAEHRVKRAIILTRVADHLGLDPTEEEIREEVAALAQELGYKPENLLPRLQASEHWGDFVEGIRRRKALKYLKNQVNVQVILG